MKTAQTLCEQLGLSHQQLALLIGTSRSTVNKSILGTRSLPTAACIALAKLYGAYEAGRQQLPAAAACPPEDKEARDDRLLELRYQLYTVKRQLKKQDRQQQCRQILLPTLEAFCKMEDIKPRQKEFARLLAQLKDSKASLPGSSSHPLLAIRLRVLEFEIALLEEMTVSR